MQKKCCASLLVFCLFLSGCGGTSDEDSGSPMVQNAIHALGIATNLTTGATRSMRPAAMLGIYTGIFTAQGIFLPVRGALLGYLAQQHILQGQRTGTSDENFALLQEVGAVLQVNIVDAMNRNEDRSSTIDLYIQTLRNTLVVLERKIAELDVINERLGDEYTAQRRLVRDLERKSRDALREQDFGEAGALEQDLQQQSSILAEVEVRRDQTDDMQERFETLLDITGRRLQAIENNRKILIAGLQVIRVPGIEDLGILAEGDRWNRRRNVFGSPR